MSDEKCKTCKYAHNMRERQCEFWNWMELRGECRKNAPQVVVTGSTLLSEGTTMTCFPEVLGDRKSVV